MTRTLIAAFAGLIALSVSATAQVSATHDQERPRLKAEAVVTGEFVRIGDLVEHAGVVAEVPIFRAPDLGTTGTVPANAVVEAVRAHALIGLDTGGIREVAVTRASRTIASKEIRERIKQALASQFELGTAADITLTFDDGMRPLHVEPNAAGEPQVARITYDAYSGRFQATLDIPTGPSSHAPLRLSGRAIATVQVATVARPVERGAVLKEADVVLERRPRARIGRDVITDPAQAIGLAARNALRPGRLLRADLLTKPELVKRNEQVTLVYQVPGISLTVRGKAVEGGADGDTISVLNEQSKRTLRGIIVGPGRVVIYSSSPQLAANATPARSATQGNAH
jgi:flagellar basal body P-ring formation protein FlgA